jgi:hypothetical protein
VIDPADVEAAIEADADAEGADAEAEEDGDSSSTDSSSSSSSTGSVGSYSSELEPVGVAADGSSDVAREKVLEVRSVTRSSHMVERDGRRKGQAVWFEVVNKSRGNDVLASLWHPGGTQALSASKLYALACQRYVGISWQQVQAFLDSRETAQLASSNVVADKILSPTLPRFVNETWRNDVLWVPAAMASQQSAGMHVGGPTSITSSTFLGAKILMQCSGEVSAGGDGAGAGHPMASQPIRPSVTDSQFYGTNGVVCRDRKFVVEFTIDGQNRQIASFDTQLEAAVASDLARLVIHGPQLMNPEHQAGNEPAEYILNLPGDARIIFLREQLSINGLGELHLATPVH